MKRRDFIKTTGAGTLFSISPMGIPLKKTPQKLRIAQIGVGGKGAGDMASMDSHPAVEIVGLCDVDSDILQKAHQKYPGARVFADYRELLKSMQNEIDAVVVSTPDHMHAPISLMAMKMNKHVYCQKPLTRYVSEAREMEKVARENGLVTQMGIQVHSIYDYVLATQLIRRGIVGKVKKVIAWSPKVWGYDGPEPSGSDPVPSNVDWDLWLGDARQRPYKEGFYHRSNWRKILDYGNGTLGDMGVHIFDTPYNALELGIPLTVKNKCRKPNGFSHPEANEVTYVFPGTKHTAEKLTWIWYDGEGAPKLQKDLKLPDDDKLPDQGAMFIGENGRRFLLPHYKITPVLIVKGEYQPLEPEKYQLEKVKGKDEIDYGAESLNHYHQFVDACLGKGECSAPFSYASRLTEVMLLGVIAAQFPNKKLHWDSRIARFRENEANKFLKS